MCNYTFNVSDKRFCEMANCEINELLLVNNADAKKYQIKNQIKIVNEQDAEKYFMAEIVEMYYFDSIMDALIMLDKKKLGYSNRKPLTQIEDALLTKIKAEDVQKYGVVVLEFKRI